MLKFIKDWKDYSPQNVFIAEMSVFVSDRNGLFNDLSVKLHFPDYFGSNWDAVWDCLCDFHWIQEKGVVMLYPGLPDVDTAILKNYLCLLRDASDDWKEGEEHYLDIVFPETVRTRVELLLQDYESGISPVREI